MAELLGIPGTFKRLLSQFQDVRVAFRQEKRKERKKERKEIPKGHEQAERTVEGEKSTRESDVG